MPRKTIAGLEYEIRMLDNALSRKDHKIELLETQLVAASKALEIMQRFNSTATIAMEKICDATAHALGDVRHINRERRN